MADDEETESANWRSQKIQAARKPRRMDRLDTWTEIYSAHDNDNGAKPLSSFLRVSVTVIKFPG